MARYRSVLLSLEGNEKAAEDGPTVLRIEILNSLLEAGIERDTVEGIESVSRNKWFVVFAKQGDRNTAIGKSIDLNGKSVELKHPFPTRSRPQQRYKRVRVFGYPLDSDREILRKSIAFFGDIKYINDMYDRNCQIKTGVREVVIELKHQIPSYIYAGKTQVRTDYLGQVKTCRKCKESGHIAKDCQASKANDLCKECGSSEHNKANCPNRRCYRCHEIGHIETSCPQYYEDFPQIGGFGNQRTEPENLSDLLTSWGDSWANEPNHSETENEDTTTQDTTTETIKDTNTTEETNMDTEQTVGDQNKSSNSSEKRNENTENNVIPPATSETATISGEFPKAVPGNHHPESKTTSDKSHETTTNKEIKSQDKNTSTTNELRPTAETTETNIKETPKEDTKTHHPKSDNATERQSEDTKNSENDNDNDQRKEEASETTPTNSDMEDGTTNSKRGHEQTTGDNTPEKRKLLKKRKPIVSQAKNRNPFY